MKITLWCERQLALFALQVRDVAAFVGLLKEWGFEDEEGEEYRFHSAHLEESGLFVLLEQKGE